MHELQPIVEFDSSGCTKSAKLSERMSCIPIRLLMLTSKSQCKHRVKKNCRLSEICLAQNIFWSLSHSFSEMNMQALICFLHHFFRRRNFSKFLRHSNILRALPWKNVCDH